MGTPSVGDGDSNLAVKDSPKHVEILQQSLPRLGSIKAEKDMRNETKMIKREKEQKVGRKIEDGLLRVVVAPIYMRQVRA